MKYILINDVNAFKVAAGFVSTDKTRPNINGIHITAEGHCASTDGNILFTAPCTNKLDGPITIKLSRAIPKNTADIAIDIERKVLRVSAKGKQLLDHQTIEISNDIYPDFERCFPENSGPGEAPVTIGLDVTTKLLKAIAAGSSTKYGGPAITFNSRQDALKTIEVEIQGQPEARCLIMPRRIKD